MLYSGLSRHMSRLRLHLLCWLVLGSGLFAFGQDLPRQIADETFRKMIADFSEPSGSFQYENFVSNEDDYQSILPELKQSVKPGGVFIGVGPEQNFTYIAAARPGVAFIVDIRRQNLLEHWLYKALFEMSSNRVDFVSRLFSRTPRGIPDGASVRTIFEAFERSQPDQKLYDRNLASIYERIVKVHGFDLSEEDRKGIAKVFTAFFQGGPKMDYRFNSYDAPTPSASYTQLMDASDRDGHRWSYLATEENFRLIQDYEKTNRIVPLVGDFAGSKTIRAIGQYARDHNAIISVFYTSNVDEYLYRNVVDTRYFSNVATLPLDGSSAMIRVIGGPSGLAPGDSVRIAPGKRWVSLRCSLEDVVKAAQSRQLSSRLSLNRICKQ